MKKEKKGGKDERILIIPQSVQNKIDRAIFNLPSTEWSGVLFYTMEGKFESVKITVRDFVILDIGQSAHTLIDYKPSMVELSGYIADNELEDCLMGLIHSHHKMGAFFSAEDEGTIKKEGEAREHFLSLVVDSRHTYVAKITRRIEYLGSLQGKYRSRGKEITSGNKKFTYTEVEAAGLQIIYPEKLGIQEDDLFGIANKIAEEARKNAVPEYPVQYLNHYMPVFKSPVRENRTQENPEGQDGVEIDLEAEVMALRALSMYCIPDDPFSLNDIISDYKENIEDSGHDSVKDAVTKSILAGYKSEYGSMYPRMAEAAREVIREYDISDSEKERVLKFL